MIVLGWLVLLAMAAYAWFFTIGGTFASLGLTGKVSPAFLVPLAIALGLSYAVWINCPFQLVQIG